MLFLFNKDSQFQLLVIDGMTDEDTKQFMKNVRCSHIKKVFVTSMSLVIPMNEMDSWSEADYNRACANQAFLNSIKHNLCEKDCTNCECDIEDLKVNKFFLAGHSARYYFGMSVERVRKDLKLQLKKMNVKDYCGLSVGSRNQEVVNHVLATGTTGTLKY